MKFWILILFLINFGISQEEGYIDSSKVRDPKLAWKLSIIPGLGQLYNGKFIKAAGFAGAEYIAIEHFIESRNTNKIGSRNTYAWWIFGIFVWNVLDAYVDAQMSTFPVKKLESNNVQDSLLVKSK